ncbi:MAG: hypothetical protein QXT06_04720 [Candidatus Bathyarchaeia archaeon]
MSEDAEEVKRLLAIKRKMEKRVEDLKAELEETQSILEVINSLILSKGFKRADTIAKTPPVTPETPEKFKEVIQLNTISGEPLARIYVGESKLKVVLDKKLDPSTPPFKQFLIERVLEKMHEKDLKLVEAGQLKPSEVFSYEIINDGNLVSEIIIKNFNEERLRDLKSSIRWTLEKMYEKTKGKGALET